MISKQVSSYYGSTGLGRLVTRLARRGAYGFRYYAGILGGRNAGKCRGRFRGLAKRSRCPILC